MTLSAPRDGIWRNAELLDGVESLRSFHATPDRAAVDADPRRIKDLEALLRID